MSARHALVAAGLVLLCLGRPRASDLVAAPGEQPPEAARLIAHQGYAAVAPENTLAAVRAAVAAGVPRVWVDVRTTADGVLVLLHDESLERTTSCTGEVAARTAAALTACDAGSWFDPRFAGEPVPTLDAVLAEPGVELVLDLQAAMNEAVLAAIRAAGAAGRVAVAAPDVARLAAIEAAEPAVGTWLRTGRVDRTDREAIVAAGLDGAAVDPVGLRAQDVAAARAAGIAITAVGAETETELFDFLALGVDRVSTARVRPAVWALGYAFRSYAAADLGRVGAAGGRFPGALASGDFDGDGRDDLVVGAPFDDEAFDDAGWLGVAFGGDGFPGRVAGSPGREKGSLWGSVLAVGDFNADGHDDLAIGYPDRDFSAQDSGTVRLWEGAAAGMSPGQRPIRDVGQVGARDGAALAVGDFNGDGVDDLAIGTPGMAVLARSGAGQVSVWPGRAGGGPSSTGALIIDRTHELVPGEVAAREGLGAVLAAGDLDGDGSDELLVGMPGTAVAAQRGAGSVLVVYGALDTETGGITTARVDEITRDTDGVPGDSVRDAELGAALAAADFDGDGYEDLVIASPGAEVLGRRGAGDLVLLYGAAGGWDRDRTAAIHQDTGLVPDEVEPRDGFGTVLHVADVDGDGRPDLVVGSPAESAGALPEAGQVVVLHGTERGIGTREALELVPGMPPLGFPAANRLFFGSAVTSGDLNGDGATDLVVAASGLEVGGDAEAGAAVVAWGYDPLRPGVPTVTPAAPTPKATATATTVATPDVPGPPSRAHLPYAGRLSRLPR